jgi:tRNA nucleotidyltransferase/poly(A) polymerase
VGLKDELLRLFPRLRDLPGDTWVVGGAVRDLIFGAAPADVDVACFDPLACARALGRKVIRLGREEHLSAWRVVDGAHVYDFAALLDGSIEADLARRDFTVNAMAVNLTTGAFLDPHDGRGDLERRLVRMIDPANFDDDPLRMLKAVRMAVRLGFTIDGATLEAIRRRAGRIDGAAAERIGYELTVIFSTNAFRGALTLLRETALDFLLFGHALDASLFHADDVPLAAALALVVNNPRDFSLRWRLSELLQRDVISLQRLREKHGLLDLYDAGERVARQLAPMLKALGRDERIPLPDFALRPLLAGDEIASLAGIVPGPRVGALKRALLEAQLAGGVTSRDEAVALVIASA